MNEEGKLSHEFYDEVRKGIPDQKPPPRNDMSAITTEEFSNQILCSHINGDAYVWNHNCQVIQSAIDQSTAAMRDELERVKGDINGLIADRDKYKDAADTLEAQAATMRHWLWRITQFNRLEGTVTKHEIETLLEDTQAGAALLKRVQALEAALRGIRGLCDYRAKQDGLQLAVQCRDEADAALSQAEREEKT